MSLFEDPNGIIAWFDRMRSNRHNTENTWQEISDHCLGMRDFTTERSPGRIRNEYIYDTTSMFSHQLLAGALHGMLTNPATDWFDMETDDPRILMDPDAKFWIADAKRKMLTIFQSQSSNFVTQAAESYLDISGFGMAGFSAMPAMRGNSGISRGVKFATHPLRELYVDVNDEREVNTIFREIPLTARQWAMRFPKDNDKDVSKALEGGNSESTFRAVHCIAPSDDAFAGKSPFSMPWTSTIVAKDNPRILDTGGFRELPILTPRWTVEPGEIYGRGPAWLALAEQKMLNQMARTILTAAQKAADPPLLVTNEAVLSGIRTRPGGVNIVQQLFGQAGAGEPIRPLANNANHQLSVEMLRQRQQQVQNAYHSHVLQLFQDPRMTATQVLELSNQAQRLMAPMLGRVQREFLEPVINRTFNILFRQGVFLPVPTVLKGVQLNITYVSPVSRAQRAAEAQAIVQTWQEVAMIAQAKQDPAVFDNFDADESARFIHAARGAPSQTLADADSMAQMREGRAQQAQEAGALEQLGAGADIVNKLAQAQATEAAVAA